MKIVEFYRGERGNCNGDTLDQMVGLWTDGMLEMDHDYIKWMFPSNEPSMLNCDAPVLTKDESKIFESDPELQEKVKQSFIRFLKVLQFKMSRDDDAIRIEAIEPENTPGWLRTFNHNMLRVTRVLKCLRLTGNTRYANAFYDALRPYFVQVSPNTYKFWTSAIFDPLWPEVVKL